MSTIKQIEANRANAKKSTGPKTSVGKAISARNLTSHGHLAAAVVLPSESVGRFYKVLDNLIAEFKPSTPTENILVENMAVARWRQLRIWRFEREMTLTSGDLERLHRYENSYIRSFASNRNTLKKFRTLSAQQFPSKLRERKA